MGSESSYGSALNLNIHFHMLFLDGVYIGGPNGHPVRFRSVKAPTGDELTKLTHTIARRVSRYLERRGLLERDTGNCYLTPEAVHAADENPSNHLLGSSITYHIAVGPQQGRNGTTHVLFEPLDFMYRAYGMLRAQEAHDCRDAGGRAGAVAEERPFPDWSHWSPNHALTLHVFMVFSRPIVSIGHW